MEDTRDVRGVAGEPSEDGAVFAAQADADVAVEQAVAVAVPGDEQSRTGSASLLPVAAMPTKTPAPLAAPTHPRCRHRSPPHSTRPQPASSPYTPPPTPTTRSPVLATPTTPPPTP